MEAADPKYPLRATVYYVDHHGRSQTGEIWSIAANWLSWGNGTPHLTYTVSHPTYHGKRMYVGEDGIRGLALSERNTHEQ